MCEFVTPRGLGKITEHGADGEICPKSLTYTAFVHVFFHLSFSAMIASDQHFVDLHRTALISAVKDTSRVLDKLLEMGFISGETYDVIRAVASEHEQMREIFKFVCSAGRKGKEALYKILKGMKNLRPLMYELER